MGHATSGGVYGTILASALLAALQRGEEPYTPYYDASWVLVTAGTAALAHGYARHMSTHTPGSGTHRWRQLIRVLGDEWPVIVASWPTVILLVLSGIMKWPETHVTYVGLMLNAALLFGWGLVGALRMGYRRRSAVLIGLADSAIALGIAAANAVIK
ncbi:hypothetical protein [Streptomyces sp. NPDC059009]|uniref:hypothetical protein n=1 Tax=Streptomyces sp. NPDC059009 TaxID=3346694 RepID=UPI0036B74067